MSVEMMVRCSLVTINLVPTVHQIGPTTNRSLGIDERLNVTFEQGSGERKKL